MKWRFDQLIAGGAATVHSLKGEPEELDFDCKRKKNPSVGEPDREDKETLGKMLSAFSNSMGGLLLWGVDARPDASGIDCVQGFEPIADIHLFESRIKTLAIEALMPRIGDVTIQAIEDAPGSGEGYLAVYIDRSERRPHRCEFGDKVYYRRAGSSCRQMEHFEIEDAFRRLAMPELTLSREIVGAGYMSGGALPAEASIGLLLRLSNVSRVSATLPYLIVPMSPFVPDPGRAGVGLPFRRDGDVMCFEGDSGIAIHPGLSRLMAAVRLTVPVTLLAGQRLVRRELLERVLAVRFGCRDLPVHEENLALSPEELLKGVEGGTFQQ